MSKFEELKHMEIEKLEQISPYLADKIKEMASKLHVRPDDLRQGVTSISYWINVDTTSKGMFICADNGYDITKEIEVPFDLVDKINEVAYSTH
jgi:hypothetical protein